MKRKRPTSTERSRRCRARQRDGLGCYTLTYDTVALEALLIHIGCVRRDCTRDLTRAEIEIGLAKLVDLVRHSAELDLHG